MCSDRYKLLITGGAPLRGETTVFGGKNTSVAVVPAMLLCDEPCVVENLSLIHISETTRLLSI